MFRSEIIILKVDKEELIKNIERINEILEKYPYSSDYTLHTVTSMTRAKSLSKEAQTWIKLLEADNP